MSKIGVDVFGPEVRGVPGSEEILTTEACHFVAELVREFRAVHAFWMHKRQERTAQLRAGILPKFNPDTKVIRDGTWHIAPVPKDLVDRRVEITGPASSRKMVINALNSGANVFMADAEDSESPTWHNIIAGQVNLRDAVRRTISLDAGGKQYRLHDQTAVLMFRPRGWHLVEKHFIVDGHPAPAALVDFGLYFFHNAQVTAPYFYLPKMESAGEASLWNKIFGWSQDRLNIPNGTIKATFLCETILAPFELAEMLWELRDHSAGANCGRWDYIFSYIKKLGHSRAFLLPDRAQVTMDKAFLAAYAKYLVQTCHKHGAHAMGGMSAFIPLKDPVENEKVLTKVWADKVAEAALGHDGAWIAHPGLRETVQPVFPVPNQLGVIPEGVITEEDLLRPHQGTITENGLRTNLEVAVQYLTPWLAGTGCVPLNNLMEDAATAEISRVQVWQWLKHRVHLDDTSNMVTEHLVGEILNGLANSSATIQAARLVYQLVTAKDCPEFLTVPAYEELYKLEVRGEI